MLWRGIIRVLIRIRYAMTRLQAATQLGWGMRKFYFYFTFFESKKKKIVLPQQLLAVLSPTINLIVLHKLLFYLHRAHCCLYVLWFITFTGFFFIFYLFHFSCLCGCTNHFLLLLAPALFFPYMWVSFLRALLRCIAVD